MDIEEKLKEVGEYFKEKILEGDYTLLTADSATAHIVIDDLYNFNLWIANEPKDDFRIYTAWPDDNILVVKFNSQKERLQGWRKIKPMLEKYNNDIAKEQKRKQIKQLQKDIDKIEATK